VDLPLSNLFPDGTYQHQMGFRMGSFAVFFSRTAEHDQLIAERKRWLQTEPDKYTVFTPEAGPLIEETLELAQLHGTLSLEDRVLVANAGSVPGKCGALAEAWEPDFMILHRGSDEIFRLAAGVVCFPSSWSLSGKSNQTLETIHSPVPGLNQQLQKQIHVFLGRLRPESVWLRTNWGLSASPELNQHPDRDLPSLQLPVDANKIWLRIENQALTALPKTRGVLFGIRITMISIEEAVARPDVARRLLTAIQTMSGELAEYKRLTTIREPLCQWLRSWSSENL
jgi:hypothetical protein